VKLTELDPQFYRYGVQSFLLTEALSQAQGILFLCPFCFMRNAGPVGTHSVLCWFKGRGVPDEAMPAPRWAVSGTGYHDLSLSPSVHLTGEGCGWHGFITNGEVT
jgi:hypothetical protein